MWRKAGMYLCTGSSKPSLPSCTLSDCLVLSPCFHGLPPLGGYASPYALQCHAHSFHPYSLEVESCNCSMASHNAINATAVIGFLRKQQCRTS